jgi:hypothetical protein
VRQGELLSYPFFLEGDTLSAWISGGAASEDIGVAVCDACTGQELIRLTPGSPTLSRQSIAVEELRGRSLRWKIFDHMSEPGGWVGVDDLEESARDGLGPAPVPPVISWEQPAGGEQYNAGDNIKPDWSASHPSGIDSAIVYISYDGGETLRRVGRRENGHPDFLPWGAPDTLVFGAFFRLVAYAGDGSVACLDTEPFNINVTVDVGGPLAGDGLRVWMSVDRVYLEGSIPAGAPGREATLEVFDVLGRRVASPWTGRSGDRFRVAAPTRDVDGRRLASGVYFARLRHGNAAWHARFVLLTGR